MALQYVNPEEMVHPLRLEKDDDYWRKVLQAADRKEEWMTSEDLEAALDFLYDYIAMTHQTHEGVTTLQ